MDRTCNGLIDAGVPVEIVAYGRYCLWWFGRLLPFNHTRTSTA